MSPERSSRSSKGPKSQSRSESLESQRRQRRRELPAEVIDEIAQAIDAEHSARVLSRLGEATYAFQRERWSDARSTLIPLVKTYPHITAIRELYGLVLYRMERWKDAAKELEAVVAAGDSMEHLPVLADCYRAMGRHEKVDSLWEQLRQGGVGAETLIEGRMVAAGSLSDRGRFKEAIALLEDGPIGVRKPQEHHLRLWYALASMYERAGDIPRARSLFKHLRSVAGDFADVAQRLAALS